MANPKLTNEIIDAAILGFEQQQHRLDAQIAELRTLRTGGNETVPVSRRPRRKMSTATRKAMAEGQRKRWAASKAQSEAKAPKAKMRKLSAAGRAAIIDMRLGSVN